MEELIFSVVHLYNTLETGITIPVSLINGENDVNFKAKIDTGSTHCIFERIHGENLGFDIEMGFRESFGTATGNFIGYGHQVNISVLSIKIEATVYFAESEYFTRNVLGRQGFLDRVKFGLIDYEGKLFLASNNE